MKKMWIQLKDKYKIEDLKGRLEEIGKVEPDPGKANRVVLTFHNQSESGIRMAGFKLSQEFIEYFEDFDMIR